MRIEAEGFMNGNLATAGQYSGQRIFTLLGNLRQDFTEMVRSEIHLLKSEISAAISSMGKDGVMVAVGGLIAYTGVVLALVGLATLIAFALRAAGLSTLPKNLIFHSSEMISGPLAAGAATHTTAEKLSNSY